MRPVEAIFLDFDGVILESVDVKGQAFGTLFESYHQHVDEIIAFHYANGGMSRFDKFRHIYENILRQPLPDEEFGRLCEDFSVLVFRKVVASDFVPGAFEFIKEYSARLPLYVISGTPQEEMVKIVKAKGLDPYFKGVFGSPVPKGVWAREIIEKNHFTARNVLFVGDATSDYEAASDNGLIFAARVKDATTDVFKEKNVDFVISDLFDLDKLLSVNCSFI